MEVVLSQSEWQERERAHQARADSYAAEWRARQGTGRSHPVDDFLFTYYPYKPSLLRRWHPGAGVVLAGAAGAERSGWKWYAVDGDDVRVDTPAMVEARGASIRFITSLLSRTAERPGNFGCFGLHEWAMVYKLDATRHDVPLRLGSTATDDVVESHRIACSHIDAFRFFTPEAMPLNKLTPTRENQPIMEQPGCLHANMDVYKWAIKLGPLVPGELLLDCFALARDIRQLDMQASPYDLADWGYEPVRIETAAGKAEYETAQRGFASRANELRRRVLALPGLAEAAPRSTVVGEAAPAAGVVPPAAGEAVPAAGKAASTAGVVPPMAVEVVPAAGEAASTAGVVMPAAGEAGRMAGENVQRR